MDEEILKLQQWISGIAIDSPGLPRLQHRLATVLFERSKASGNRTHDLSAAIYQERAANDNTSCLSITEQEEVAAHLFNMLVSRWYHSRTLENSEAAIEQGIILTTMLPDSSSELCNVFFNLSQVLRYRNYDQDDLDAALKYAEDAVAHLPERRPEYPSWLFNIAYIRCAIYDRQPNRESLEDCITRMEEAKRLMTDNDPIKKKLCEQLAISYNEMFKYKMDTEDLDKAFAVQAEWWKIPAMTLPYDNENRPSIVHARRFLRDGNLQELDTALSLTRSQLQDMDDKLPEKVSVLQELAEMIGFRFERLGDMNDLKCGIEVARRQLNLITKGHENRIGALNSLCWFLYNGNTDIEAKSEIEEVIEEIKEILLSIGPHQEERYTLYKMLSIALGRHFRETDQVAFLEDGISNARQALSLSATDEEHVEALDCLSSLLEQHFTRTGDENTMNEAVSTSRQLIAHISEDHPRYSRYSILLARQVTQRSMKTGNTVELNEAIDIFENVNQILPEDHFLQLRSGAPLSALYMTRYHRSKSLSDLEAAITVLERCAEIAQEGSQEQGVTLVNLAKGRTLRFRHTKLKEDFVSAVSQFESALETPFAIANKETKARGLYGLAELRRIWYPLSHDLTQLDRAIEESRQAVEALPGNHPDLVGAHLSLGSGLEYRGEETRSDRDIWLALESYNKACALSSGSPDLRIVAALRAIYILTEREDWVQGEKVADLAINLMPRACSRKLNQEDQIYALKHISRLPLFACSISLRSGNVGKALQNIEFGRGLVLGHLIDEKSDLSTLRGLDPKLCDEYQNLRTKASTAVTNLDEIYQELEDYEKRIRQLEGLERFALPQSVKDFQSTARDGPIVVVNVSHLGADAIIVTEDDLRHVKLSQFMHKLTELGLQCVGDSEDMEQRDFEPESALFFDADFLNDLWSTCVRPILDRIIPDLDSGVGDRDLPRIWWIGTGGASQIPFHAATSSQKVPSLSTLDLTIPSYTPTIKSLQNARHRASRAQRVVNDGSPTLLAVTMATTPGSKALPGVKPERVAIEVATKGVYHFKELERPDSTLVLDSMREAQIVHFACHGLSDPMDPLQSHLILQKSVKETDRLTVKSLLTVRAESQAWIAYLSACSTAQVSSIQLVDEGLHVTSAFQVAGFAHVIGSMWPVGDSISIEVARVFYETLSKSQVTGMLNKGVAEALREAVLAVRNRFPDNFTLWAPYLHYGA